VGFGQYHADACRILMVSSVRRRNAAGEPHSKHEMIGLQVSAEGAKALHIAVAVA